jgi:hypothetical protein
MIKRDTPSSCASNLTLAFSIAKAADFVVSVLAVPASNTYFKEKV